VKPVDIPISTPDTIVAVNTVETVDTIGMANPASLFNLIKMFKGLYQQPFMIVTTVFKRALKPKNLVFKGALQPKIHFY
jgi:hypothetical protein